MPFNTEIRDVLTGAGNIPRATHLSAIEKRYSYTLQVGENAADFVPGLTQSIQFLGRIFSRDDADTTTPHDGTFCIVTSGGVRFKSDTVGNGPTVRRFAVTSFLSTPPGSPTVGQSHIVGAGGTGAWATKDGQVATWTLAGWRFTVPKSYEEAHVSALAQVYHFNASSVWVSGVPAFSFIDNSIHFSKLKHGLGQAVENASTNAPPGSPTEGVAYIVGGSPTGAWTGQALKLAIYENSAWVFYTPQQGWAVFDKSSQTELQYKSLGWSASVSGYSKIHTSTSDVGTQVAGTFFGSGSMASASSWLLQQTSYTPKRAGALVEIEYRSNNVTFTPAGGFTTGPYWTALFIDAGASSTNFVRSPYTITSALLPGTYSATFLWTTPDTLAHDIKIRAANNFGDYSHTMDDHMIIIREHA